jgi:hypothetical protein
LHTWVAGNTYQVDWSYSFFGANDTFLLNIDILPGNISSSVVCSSQVTHPIVYRAIVSNTGSANITLSDSFGPIGSIDYFYLRVSVAGFGNCLAASNFIRAGKGLI